MPEIWVLIGSDKWPFWCWFSFIHRRWNGVQHYASIVQTAYSMESNKRFSVMILTMKTRTPILKLT